MKTTTIIVKLRRLVFGLLLVTARGSWAEEAPTIAPSEDQMICVDPSGNGETLDLTASGGSCNPPDSPPDGGGTGNGDCTWVVDGDVYYVWTYDDADAGSQDGLSADPGSGDDPGSSDDDNQDTLSIDESHAGYSSVTVYAVQNWKASDGSDQSAVTHSSGRTLGTTKPHTDDGPSPSPSATQSPASSPVNTVVQVPSSIEEQGSSGTLDSQFTSLGFAGVKYTFNVKDQTTQNNLKNGTYTVKESIVSMRVVTSALGFQSSTRSPSIPDDTPLDLPAGQLNADGTFSDNIGINTQNEGENLEGANPGQTIPSGTVAMVVKSVNGQSYKLYDSRGGDTPKPLSVRDKRVGVYIVKQQDGTWVEGTSQNPSPSPTPTPPTPTPTPKR